MRPVLLEVGGKEIFAYGWFLGLAFAFGLVFGIMHAKSRGLPLGRTALLALASLAAAVPGSALVQRLMAHEEGHAFLGGVLLAVPVVVVGARALRLAAWDVADAFILGTAAGILPARLGCYFAGCCYGVAADEAGWPHIFASVFPEGARGAPANVPLIPTQLIEAIGGALVFFILFGLRKKQRFPGHLVALFFVFYGPLRMALETLRDDVRGSFGPLTSAQLLLVVPVVVSAWTLWSKRARPVVSPAAT